MQVLADQGELNTDESDWVLFYTMSEAVETKAIIEVIVIESDLKKGIKKPYGIGYCIAPLFYEEHPVSLDVYKGSPREVLKNAADPGY